MDGAKVVTDTSDILTNSGRQARWLDRSLLERVGGPDSDEHPGGSRI